MPNAGSDDGRNELQLQVDRMIVFLFSTLLVALAGLLAYLYFLKNGQFEDMEDVKYQVFHEEED